MSKKPVLVIMAAGMGSRYGGLKQMKHLKNLMLSLPYFERVPDHEPIACMVEGCTDEHNVLLNADGNDLAFITVSLQDIHGGQKAQCST